MKKAVLVLSGGQDSTTCGFWAKSQGMELHAVTMNYGQLHEREIESAYIIADLLGCKTHKMYELGGKILESSSPLVNRNSKLEQYKDHQSLPGGLEKTFVPMRNQLFLTLAANRAHALGCNTLITGVCQEDSGGYPDCTLDFIQSFAHTSMLGTFTDGGLEILTPLMKLTKAQSVQLALSLTGCYEALQHTHTSYDGAYPPVGKDHATLLRAKGFEEAGVPDPLVLRACADKLMPVPTTENYNAENLIKYLNLLGMD